MQAKILYLLSQLQYVCASHTNDNEKVEVVASGFTYAHFSAHCKNFECK